MAVIKIVPMPGAVGDKGDPGETGAQGPQGQTGQTGQNGQDALWSYQGAWQSNAAYAVGDLVTYEGQLYYAKAITTTGTLPTDTSKFDLIAAKGADGTNGTIGSQLNYWDGASVPQDPAEDGFLIVDGIVTGPGSNILVSADDRVFIGGNNGEFLNGLSTPENQIATIGDLTTPTSGSWGHDFFEESGLTTSTYDVLSDYYKIGELVYFDLSVNLGYVTNWGSPLDLGGGVLVWPTWTFKLPYPIHNYGSAHNSALTNIIFTGTIFDTSLAENISERTANDQGSNVIFGKLSQSGGNTYVNIYTVSQSDYAGYAEGELRPVNSLYPKDFTQPANIQTGPVASRLRISGTYRSE